MNSYKSENLKILNRQKISNLRKKEIMKTISISNRILDKYFGFLKTFDKNSKKRLITKLEESIASNSYNKLELCNIFGAWEDTKDSTKIIKEIRASRVEKPISENF